MYRMRNEEKEMGKVKSWAMDLEEQFFDAASDIVLECENYKQFIEVMKTQMDLVVHMDKSDVEYILSDIWYEYTSWN